MIPDQGMRPSWTTASSTLDISGSKRDQLPNHFDLYQKLFHFMSKSFSHFRMDQPLKLIRIKIKDFNRVKMDKQFRLKRAAMARRTP